MARNFGLREQRDFTISATNTKALRGGKVRFSYDAAQIKHSKSLTIARAY